MPYHHLPPIPRHAIPLREDDELSQSACDAINHNCDVLTAEISELGTRVSGELDVITERLSGIDRQLEHIVSLVLSRQDYPPSSNRRGSRSRLAVVPEPDQTQTDMTSERVRKLVAEAEVQRDGELVGQVRSAAWNGALKAVRNAIALALVALATWVAHDLLVHGSH